MQDARRTASGSPDGILASVWVLYAAAAATAVADPAREQKDEEDDDDDCEHVHLPNRIWIGLRMGAYLLVLLRPVRVSATLSTAFFAEPLAWSARPSFFRRLFPVTAPAASLARPFTLSVFLLVMNPPIGWVVTSARPGASGAS